MCRPSYHYNAQSVATRVSLEYMICVGDTAEDALYS